MAPVALMDKRTDCPDENLLLEYLRQMMPKAVRDELERHFDSCVDCRAVLSDVARGGFIETAHGTDNGSGLTAGAGAASRAAALGAFGDAPQNALTPTTALPRADFAGASGAIPAAALPEIGETVGRFIVQRKLGAGGMGVVYECADPVLGRNVALKLLRGDSRLLFADEARARLLREARAVARLSSPHVITIHDVGLWREATFIAMELVEGTTLAGWLQERQRPWRETLETMLKAGAGLVAVHHAGIVHRDFKPDNVLVGHDGRIVVTDFGLASAPVNLLSSSVQDESATAASLTRTGALLGTPAYMAPEQLAGERADAKSDQFSFCVTCWEALFGSRPFGGTTLRELKKSLARPPVPPPSPVPPRVRQALLRGLSAAPAQRFATFEELLRALAPPPAPRRLRWWLNVAAATALALVAAAVGLVLTRDPGAACRRSLTLADVWNAARAGTIRQAFERSGRPFAATSFATLDAALASYTAAFAAARDDACDATWTRREQEEGTLELRLACLAERRAAAIAFTDALLAPDDVLVRNAVRGAERLPDLAVCADIAALRAPVKPPDEAVAAAVTTARGELAAISGARSAGRASEALARARELAAKAEALGYRPLVAEVYALRGELEDDAGHTADAMKLLHRAITEAEASGHLLATVRAWSTLLAIHTEKSGRYDDAHEAAEHAQALLERLGSEPKLARTVALNHALLQANEGKPLVALPALEEVLAFYLRNDPTSAEAARAHAARGKVLFDLARREEAEREFSQALTLLAKQLGDEHPDVAMRLKDVGNTYFARGELAPALAHYEKALAIQRRAFSPDAPEVAQTLVNVGAIHLTTGDFAKAVAALATAVQIDEHALGPEHRDIIAPLLNLGVAYQALGKLDEAEATLTRALKVAEKSSGADHPDCETALLNLADVYMSQKRPERAVEAYARAARISETALGADHPAFGEDLGGQGMALLELGRFNEALTTLERALAILEHAESNPLSVAKVRFGHARALWQMHPEQRPAARQMVQTSRNVLAGAGAIAAADLANVDRWLQKTASR